MSFGTIRIVLSIMVVLNHLWLPTSDRVGAHAVLAFYIISGFLMTNVINEVYCGKWGRIRFITNRVLRIYPLYFVVIGLTLFGLIVFPSSFGSVYSLIHLPRTAHEWFANLTLITLTDSPTILAPPAWSLFVEFFFYIIISIIGRSRLLVLTWVCCSIAYTCSMIASGAPFAERYYPLAAASLFFSTGSLFYHYSEKIYVPTSIARYWPMLLVVFVISPVVIEFFGGNRLMLGFYGAALLFFMVFTFIINDNSLTGTKIDQFLGNLAYPIFLLHFFSAGMVNLLTGNRYPVLSGYNFILSITLCILLSIIVVQWFEPAVERFRRTIRPQNCPSA